MTPTGARCLPKPQRAGEVGNGRMKLEPGPDARELDEDWFAKAKSANRAFAPETYAALRQFITEHPINR